jgi:hypothetical protein
MAIIYLINHSTSKLFNEVHTRENFFYWKYGTTRHLNSHINLLDIYYIDSSL